MKTLCLFILTFLVLYNPKVEANSTDVDVRALDNAEFDLTRINLQTKTPLKNVDENLVSYTELVKIFKDFKIYNINLSSRLLTKIEGQNTFTGDELYLIKRTFDMHYKLNKKMLEFANLYQYKSLPMAKTFAEAEVKLPLVKAHMIWLSSNVLIMDQMQEIHKIIYQKDGNFRRIFKMSIHSSKITPEEKRKLKELSEQVNAVTETAESKTFSQQIILVRGISNELKTVLANEPLALNLVAELDTNTIAIQVAQGKKDFTMEAYGIEDASVSLFNRVTNSLSAFFGNVAGNIKWRKGYLFDNAPATELAKANLKPMDIILEKSPFVLTDKFIPGHFGHVAIYLGTKEQLEAIGMWNHPDIVPYHNSIEDGKTILEAVRPGVRLNTVEAFLNIDEMTIMRKLDGLESPAQVYEEISRGMDQIGKDYDFNFDIATLDKIVCSELIYIVFGNVNWPTNYRLGRATITPDDVADVLFMKNTRFKVNTTFLSTERHRIEMSSISRLANIFEYELRAENGDVIKDPADPANSFWKKETKCYNVESPSSRGESSKKKTCKTTYKEYYYAEAGS